MKRKNTFNIQVLPGQIGGLSSPILSLYHSALGRLSTKRSRPGRGLTAFTAFTIAMCLAQFSEASTNIRFPETDLPQETVRPVFDRPDVVMNQYIKTARRLELGLLGGWTPTDPFFSPYSIGISAGYHINETHGINLQWNQRLSGTTEYVDQLNNVQYQRPLKLQNAPSTKSVGILSYQANLFYGKISLTKNTVSHLSTFVTAGPAMIQLGDGTLLGVAAGIGQKYYLSQSLGLRFDARVLFYEGPDVVSRSLADTAGTPPNSTFAKRMFFDSVINVSFIYMFPAF